METRGGPLMRLLNSFPQNREENSARKRKREDSDSSEDYEHDYEDEDYVTEECDDEDDDDEEDDLPRYRTYHLRNTRNKTIRELPKVADTSCSRLREILNAKPLIPLPRMIERSALIHPVSSGSERSAVIHAVSSESGVLKSVPQCCVDSGDVKTAKTGSHVESKIKIDLNKTILRNMLENSDAASSSTIISLKNLLMQKRSVQPVCPVTSLPLPLPSLVVGPDSGITDSVQVKIEVLSDDSNSSVENRSRVSFVGNGSIETVPIGHCRKPENSEECAKRLISRSVSLPSSVVGHDSDITDSVEVNIEVLSDDSNCGLGSSVETRSKVSFVGNGSIETVPIGHCRKPENSEECGKSLISRSLSLPSSVVGHDSEITDSVEVNIELLSDDSSCGLGSNIETKNKVPFVDNENIETVPSSHCREPENSEACGNGLISRSVSLPSSGVGHDSDITDSVEVKVEVLSDNSNCDLDSNTETQNKVPFVGNESIETVPSSHCRELESSDECRSSLVSRLTPPSDISSGLIHIKKEPITTRGYPDEPLSPGRFQIKCEQFSDDDLAGERNLKSRDIDFFSKGQDKTPFLSNPTNPALHIKHEPLSIIDNVQEESVFAAGKFGTISSDHCIGDFKVKTEYVSDDSTEHLDSSLSHAALCSSQNLSFPPVSSDFVIDGLQIQNQSLSETVSCGPEKSCLSNVSLPTPGPQEVPANRNSLGSRIYGACQERTKCPEDNIQKNMERNTEIVPSTLMFGTSVTSSYSRKLIELAQKGGGDRRKKSAFSGGAVPRQDNEDNRLYFSKSITENWNPSTHSNYSRNQSTLSSNCKIGNTSISVGDFQNVIRTNNVLNSSMESSFRTDNTVLRRGLNKGTESVDSKTGNEDSQSSCSQKLVEIAQKIQMGLAPSLSADQLLIKNGDTAWQRCEVCKLKAPKTVRFRLPVTGRSSTNFRQWRVCEKCEVDLIEHTIIAPSPDDDKIPFSPRIQSVESLKVGNCELISNQLQPQQHLTAEPHGDISHPDKQEIFSPQTENLKARQHDLSVRYEKSKALNKLWTRNTKTSDTFHSTVRFPQRFQISHESGVTNNACIVGDRESPVTLDNHLRGHLDEPLLCMQPRNSFQMELRPAGNFELWTNTPPHKEVVSTDTDAQKKMIDTTKIFRNHRGNSFLQENTSGVPQIISTKKTILNTLLTQRCLKRTNVSQTVPRSVELNTHYDSLKLSKGFSDSENFVVSPSVSASKLDDKLTMKTNLSDYPGCKIEVIDVEDECEDGYSNTVSREDGFSTMVTRDDGYTVSKDNFKPFVCNLCKLSYKSSDQLNSHMKVHAMDMPFACGICGQTFLENAQLQNHVKIHMELTF